MRSLVLVLAMPALASADTKVETSSKPAVSPLQMACPVAADISRPWTHEVFPGCAAFAYELHASVPADAPCEVRTSRESTYHQYDASGNFLESSGTSFAAKCFRKDGKLRSCDQGDDSARFSYDAQGRIVEVDLDKTKTTYTYDEHGDLVTIHDGKAVTELAYDNHRLVAEKTGRSVTKYRYDDDGRLVSRSDGTTYGYDDRGRLSAIYQTDRSVITIAYDASGRVASETTTDQGGRWDGRDNRIESRLEMKYCQR